MWLSSAITSSSFEPGAQTSKAGWSELPPELLLEIFRYIPRAESPYRDSDIIYPFSNTERPSKDPLHSLTLVCRRWNKVVTPILYEVVDVSALGAAQRLLRSLTISEAYEHPIGPRIQKLWLPSRMHNLEVDTMYDGTKFMPMPESVGRTIKEIIRLCPAVTSLRVPTDPSRGLPPQSVFIGLQELQLFPSCIGTTILPVLPPMPELKTLVLGEFYLSSRIGIDLSPKLSSLVLICSFVSAVWPFRAQRPAVLSHLGLQSCRGHFKLPTYFHKTLKHLQVHCSYGLDFDFSPFVGLTRFDWTRIGSWVDLGLRFPPNVLHICLSGPPPPDYLTKLVKCSQIQTIHILFCYIPIRIPVELTKRGVQVIISLEKRLATIPGPWARFFIFLPFSILIVLCFKGAYHRFFKAGPTQ